MGKVDESSWQGSQTVIATPVQNRAARVAAVELEEPSDEQPKDATAASPSPSKIAHIESRPDGLKYACRGAGVQCATVREAVRFEIVAFDEEGNLRPTASEQFMITIHGVARVRHQVVVGERRDIYTVEWKPPVSGQYTIAISKSGKQLLPPVSVLATSPEPHARHCAVRGPGLEEAVARKPAEFEVLFKDQLGATTHAVDLDVFVDPVAPGGPRSRIAAAGPDDVNQAERRKEDVRTASPSTRAPVEVSDHSKALIAAVSTAAQDMSSNFPSATSPEPVQCDGYMARYRRIRVQVGEKPLIVRSGYELDSPPLGQLLPGAVVTVVEERITPENIRACIAFDHVAHADSVGVADGGFTFRAESGATFRASETTVSLSATTGGTHDNSNSRSASSKNNFSSQRNGVRHKIKKLDPRRVSASIDVSEPILEKNEEEAAASNEGGSEQPALIESMLYLKAPSAKAPPTGLERHRPLSPRSSRKEELMRLADSLMSTQARNRKKLVQHDQLSSDEIMTTSMLSGELQRNRRALAGSTAHGRHDQHELTAHMLFSLNQRARRALARSMAHGQHDHFSRMNKMMTAHMLSSEVQRTRKSAAGSISLRQTAAAPAAAPSMARQQRKQSARDADLRKTQASRIREEESSEADGLLLDEAALWSNALIGTTGAKEGWVTLQKGNHKLVTSRLRLGTSARQLHEEQWARRVANDKVELERTEGRKGDDGWRNERPKEREVVRSQNGPIRERAVSLELDTGDPTGFAFGGVFPGTLHAHGVLRESHKVSYSIGVAGQYLLHVRLRKQAAALPGSPFLLQVHPGPAYALSSSLPFEPMSSEVGEPIVYIMKAADRIGNPCHTGGAQIECWCGIEGKETELLQAEVKDIGNGSYELRWNGKVPGTYEVSVKLAGEHVVNSPSKIRLQSTVPLLASSVVHEGVGLHNAVVNETSTITFSMRDRFNNVCLPNPDYRAKFRVCISFLKAAQMNDDEGGVERIDAEGRWLSDTSGEFELSYVPVLANQGFTELHAWHKDEKGELTPMPGMPFKLSISASADLIVSNDIDTTGATAGDYRVHRSVFDECCTKWGSCTLDAFASEPTAVVARFWTINHSEAAEGRDALTADAFERMWSKEEERIWAHPPPGILPDFADMLKRNGRKAEVLCCVPFRPSTGWFVQIASLSTDKIKYRAGKLQKLQGVDDAPDRLESWPIMVFRVPGLKGKKGGKKKSLTGPAFPTVKSDWPTTSSLQENESQAADSTNSWIESLRERMSRGLLLSRSELAELEAEVARLNPVGDMHMQSRAVS